MHQLTFEIGGATRAANIDTLIVAGWTGRDLSAVEQHITELAALGVQRPHTIPSFYRVGVNLLTQAATIDVVGSSSSGEVEFVLVSLPSGVHVGVGSDHTDRSVEAYNITVSKQMCPKPLSRELWTFADVADHWDELTLRSWVTRNGARELYQEGSVSKMLAATDLVDRYLGRRGVLPVGTVMYGGTLPAIGTICGGECFEIELHDPVRDRRLHHSGWLHHDRRVLPPAGEIRRRARRPSARAHRDDRPADACLLVQLSEHLDGGDRRSLARRRCRCFQR